jgi:type IV secretory pathway VirB10-like protein
MVSNRLAFAALGIACVAAAGGGSYFATRHNALDQFTGAGTSAAPAVATTPAAVVSQPAPDVATPSVPTPALAAETTPGTVVEQPVPSTARVPSAAPVARTAQSTRPAVAAKPASRSTPASQQSPARVAQRAEPSTAPSDTNAPAWSAPVVAAEPPAVAQRPDERSADAQTPSTPAPATFQEVVVTADSVIGLRTDTALSSERARIEDRVEARVVRDVRVGGRVAIPAGTRALGSVVVVERGGKLKERARLGIRFHTLAMADGTRVPISTETIYRYGDAPGDASAKKIGGGAIAGAILGAIIGGGKGAAIGATTGAAGGGAVVMSGDRSEAEFPAGADVTARIVSPVTVTLER